MQLDQKKYERQLLGVHKWFNSSLFGATKNCCGTLNYYTGVGKTFTAILIIRELFNRFNNHHITIIVPSEIIFQQWEKGISEHFTKAKQNYISIFTCNYIINNDIKIETGTLIIDELHEFYSENYIQIINGGYIKSENKLALTASYEDNKDRHKLIENIFPVIDVIGEKEAIEKGFTSDFVEFNLGVHLTEKEQVEYEKYTKIISKNINKFGKGGLTLATKCLSGGKHIDGKKYDAKQFIFGWAVKNGWSKNLDLSISTNVEINEIWNPYKIFGYAQKLLNSIRYRKELLYNAENKYNVIRNIICKHSEYKTIVFSQSTSFADKLNLILNSYDVKEINSVVYHSQLQTVLRPGKTGKLTKFGKTRLKREALEKLNNGEATVICTASSLDKGFNVEDLKMAITASGTSNFNQYAQRGGRAKRKLFNDDTIAILVNLYVKNSKEEVWLKKRQSNSNHLIYWIDNFNDVDIDYNLKEKINEFNMEDL